MPAHPLSPSSDRPHGPAPSARSPRPIIKLSAARLSQHALPSSRDQPIARRRESQYANDVAAPESSG